MAGRDLCGTGLFKDQEALAKLKGDLLQLDSTRKRFNYSPTPGTSDRSGTRTRTQTSDPLSEKQRCHEERLIRLGLEADASKPNEQFSTQVGLERKRIWNAHPYTSGKSMPLGDILVKEASQAVKERWVEQGIWNNKWNQFAYGRWKHEEALEIESELKMESEAGLLPTISLFSNSQPNQGRRRVMKKGDGMQS